MPFEGLIGSAVYAGFYAASFWGLTLGTGLRVAGRRNVPASGPVLFLANHQSFFDPWFVALAVAPRKLTHLARSNLFHRPAADRCIRFLGGIPIDRNFGKEGIRSVAHRLDSGAAVVIFPEGERTHTGDVQPLKPGVALVLAKARVPVVPVGIAGAYELWPRQRTWPAPEPLFLGSRGASPAVVIGETVAAAELAAMPRAAMLAFLEARIRACHDEARKLRRKPHLRIG